MCDHEQTLMSREDDGPDAWLERSIVPLSPVSVPESLQILSVPFDGERTKRTLEMHMAAAACRLHQRKPCKSGE